MRIFRNQFCYNSDSDSRSSNCRYRWTPFFIFSDELLLSFSLHLELLDWIEFIWNLQWQPPEKQFQFCSVFSSFQSLFPWCMFVSSILLLKSQYCKINIHVSINPDSFTRLFNFATFLLNFNIWKILLYLGQIDLFSQQDLDFLRKCQKFLPHREGLTNLMTTGHIAAKICKISNYVSFVYEFLILF